jgi:hypothetical protein
MTEIEIDMPERDDTPRAIERIERVMSDHDLRLVSRGTLKTYRGCVHWHYKNGDDPGTLEITLWSKRNRLWFKIQSGRRAPWIDQILPRLKRSLERKRA